MPVIDPNTGNTKIKIMRDESGKPIEQWVQGWSPMEVGESMRRLLVPYTAGISASGVNAPEEQVPAVEEAPEIFHQQAPAAGAAAPAAQTT